MHRQPYTRLIGVGPIDSMPAMRGDQQVVTRGEVACLRLVFEPQSCGARDKQYEFVLRLVVPKTIGRRLAPRNNPLNMSAGGFVQRFEKFVDHWPIDIIKQVTHRVHQR